MKEITPNERHKDLSIKFFNMGQALTKEGLDSGDFIITSLGSYLTFISTIVYSDGDIELLNEITDMISSRALLNGIASGEYDNEAVNKLREDYTTSLDGETIPEMLKRIRKDNNNEDNASDEGVSDK
jgi:hypothetical protein